MSNFLERATTLYYGKQWYFLDARTKTALSNLLSDYVFDNNVSASLHLRIYHATELNGLKKTSYDVLGLRNLLDRIRSLVESHPKQWL
ncbi:MAG: hypothetical protein ACOZAO_00890 [Patescibacteria group bacterium]